MEPIRVMLVDDQPLFRKGLASMLKEQPDFEVVGEASDGEEAFHKARELMPDLILMDVFMPRCDGLEATRRIKSEMPYVKIVMLTISEEDRVLFEAVKAGAIGYLLKKIEPEELFGMLRGVARNEAPITRATAAKILTEFTKQAQALQSDLSPISRLSPREREVLELLTQGLSNKEIGARLAISENTVKNHMKNILEQLHLQNRAQAVAFAIREGLVGKDPSSA